jgi:hypothetical protein
MTSTKSSRRQKLSHLLAVVIAILTITAAAAPRAWAQATETVLYNLGNGGYTPRAGLVF